MDQMWVLVVLVIIAALAPRYGADSRDYADWCRREPGCGPPDATPYRRHTLTADLRALGALVMCRIPHHRLGVGTDAVRGAGSGD